MDVQFPRRGPPLRPWESHFPSLPGVLSEKTRKIFVGGDRWAMSPSPRACRGGGQMNLHSACVLLVSNKQLAFWREMGSSQTPGHRLAGKRRFALQSSGVLQSTPRLLKVDPDARRSRLLRSTGGRNVFGSGTTTQVLFPVSSPTPGPLLPDHSLLSAQTETR